MRSSILITGALGYLGGRLVLGLHQAGYRVVCGTRRDLSSPPDWLPDIKMVRLDWNSLDSLGEACRGIDCVVHLSAMNEVESTKNPIGALQINGMQFSVLFISQPHMFMVLLLRGILMRRLYLVRYTRMQ